MEMVLIARHAYQGWYGGGCCQSGSWLMVGPWLGLEQEGSDCGCWRRVLEKGGQAVWRPCRAHPAGLLSAAPPTSLTGLFLSLEAACSAMSFAKILGWGRFRQGPGLGQKSIPTSYAALGYSLPSSGSSCCKMRHLPGA